MSYLSSCPSPSNIFDIFKIYPDHAQPVLALCEQSLRKESPLSVGVREFLFAYGSALNACSFCYQSHTSVSEAFGIDVSVMDALLADVETAPVDEKLKPLFRYVKKLTLNQSQLTQADAQAVYDAGWDEQAFVDMVSVCATQNCLNRFVDGTGIDCPDQVAQHAGKELLPAMGYAGVMNMLRDS